MSDMPSDYAADLSFRDAMARIDRQQAETRKFVAERDKLLAEADKLRRDRFLAPILAAGAVAGVIATVLPIVLRSWGLQ